MNSNRKPLKPIRRELLNGCLAVVAILFGTMNAYAGELDAVQVDVKVSDASVQIAEPFTMKIMVTAPAGTKVSMPAIGDQLGEFDIVDLRDINDIPSASTSNERIWKRQMTLECIATGDLEIPSMEFQVGNGTNLRIVRSDPISVRVASVLEDRADPTQFRDIHSVVDLVVPQQESTGWVWWAAGTLGLLSFGLAMIAVVTRRKKWLSPNEWAVQELQSLDQSEAMQMEDSESVSRQLASILRDYLEMQFEISAPMQTTQELMRVVESKKVMNSGTANRFKQIFEASDQAKFAGMKLTPDELSNAIDDARDLVIETSCDLESQVHSSQAMEAH